MINFKFNNIWLLSDQQKSARHVRFSPKKNLIVGMNHTGKSSLVKSMFVALGARPTGDLDRWSDDTAVLVEFSVDSKSYYVLNQRSRRSLFDGEGVLVKSADTLTAWGQIFAELVGFNLVLTDKSLTPVNADARSFFLPFYINQDGSWLSNWSTFANFQQYKNPVPSVLEYFTGVKPPEFYSLTADKNILQAKVHEARGEERVVKNIRTRVGKSIPLNGPKTVPEVFAQDVERLTEEMTLLNAQQESMRNKLVQQKETLESLALQIKMANHALAHHDRDAEYLRSETSDKLTCPTCHAEHDKAFLDILRYTEDARVLKSLVQQLEEDSVSVATLYRNSVAELRELDDSYDRISEILDVKRGTLHLNDVIQGMGAEAAFSAFEDELAELKAKIDGLLTEIAAIDADLADKTSKKRAAEILGLFRSSYIDALDALNMPSVETKGLRLTGRPNISGSGGPRSILAYYAALWQTSRGPHGSFRVPVVIDSPQQQGQDATNLPIMIKYIAEELPSEIQVILAVETPTTFEFDHKIELSEPYHLLKTGDFSAVREFMNPFFDAL